MMKIFFKAFISLSILISVSHFINAQTFIGSQIDNYGGIQTLTLNPANAAGSKYRMDINILSGSAFIGSDYLNLKFSNIPDVNRGFVFDNNVDTSPDGNNNFFGNVDILGPSVLFNIDELNSVAITTRIRTFFNLNNLGGEFYKLAIEGESNQDFNLEMEDMRGLVHAWGEVGGTYGRILLETEKHRLKGGATLKYLFGAGGIYGSSGRLGANYLSQIQSLSTSGSLNFGYTSGFDSEKISFSDVTSGFGADLGIVYEFQDQSSLISGNPYKLRFGASITDIGSISYTKTNRFLYLLEATVDASKFKDSGIVEILENNYSSNEINGKIKLGLPTALQLFADYAIHRNIYISAQGAISIKKDGEIPVSKLINSFTLTPRFERKWISICSPLSVRQFDSQLVWGIGVRAGPVIVGSGTILSNVLSSNSNSTDLYVGFKVPLYKRN